MRLFYLFSVVVGIIILFGTQNLYAAECSDWVKYSDYQNERGEVLLSADYKVCRSGEKWPVQISWRVTNRINGKSIYDVSVGDREYVFSDGSTKSASAEICGGELVSGNFCTTLTDSGPAGDYPDLVSVNLSGCVIFSLKMGGKRFNSCQDLKPSSNKKEDDLTKLGHKVLTWEELSNLRKKTEVEYSMFKMAVTNLSNSLRKYGYDIRINITHGFFAVYNGSRKLKIRPNRTLVRHVSAACYRPDKDHTLVYYSWLYTTDKKSLPALPGSSCHHSINPRSYNFTNITVAKYFDDRATILNATELWWVFIGPMKFLVKREGVREIIDGLLNIHKAAHQPKPPEITLTEVPAPKPHKKR